MTLTLKRFHDIIEAYGADPARWPDAERADAEQFAATSPHAATLLADAHALDGLLRELPPVTPSPWLARRVMAEVEERDTARPRWLQSLWPFGSIWRPAAGLIAAGLLGLVLGVATPPPTDRHVSLDPLSAAGYLVLRIDTDEVTQ